MRAVLVLTLIAFQTPPSATPGDFTAAVIKALPTWEADKLAQYEQPELAAVRLDLGELLEEGGTEDQLHEDWDALVALDKALQIRYIL